MKASSYVEMLELELLYSPDIFRLPVIVTSPVSAMAPDAPVNASGVFVVPPSLIVKDTFYSN